MTHGSYPVSDTLLDPVSFLFNSDEYTPNVNTSMKRYLDRNMVRYTLRFSSF